MYDRLSYGFLSTGERAEFGVVDAPDTAWSNPLERFLAQRGPDWRYHIGLALRGPLDALETRFYLCLVGGEIISQVTVFGARGAAILGHVYTAPAWRQRGAFRQLMAAQMADCRRRGERVLMLSTSADTPPYQIYHSFGFRPIAPGSGSMRWLATSDAEECLLQAAPACVRPLRWDDWAMLNLLALRPVGALEPLPRFPTFDREGQGTIEGRFVPFHRRLAATPDGCARVVQTATGAIVGWCFLSPAHDWLVDAWLLDIGLLPGFEAHAEALTARLAWPSAPVYAVSSEHPGRAAWLTALGFGPLATPTWSDGSQRQVDARLWRRAS